MAEQQVIEGTWEEVRLYAEELKLGGRQVKLIVSQESGAQAPPAPPLDPKAAAALAYFQDRLEAAKNASPEELERGEQEVAELMRRLNENRTAAGERPIFPG